MMYRVLWLLLIVIGCHDGRSKTSLFHQDVFEFKRLGTLEEKISESSGIVSYNNALYTHADEVGYSTLFKIDKNGSIINTHSYENIHVRDWEDIAVDDEYLYIGDIGNNLGIKEDLKIYKIPLSQISSKNPDFKTIQFHMVDQLYEVIERWQYTKHDVESLTIRGDMIYLFTKDWSELKTRVYQLSKKPGTFSIAPITTLEIDGLVTGATTNAQGHIILCGYSENLLPYVARIKFKNGSPEIVEKRRLNGSFGFPSQIEGITYSGTVDNVDIYYLTSEEFSKEVGGKKITLPSNLYQLRWETF